jgi:hypothetical protein
MITLKIVLIAVFALLAFFMILGALYLKWGVAKWLYHDIMGWHKPSETLSFDGCSFCAVCRYCKKKIMQDSQGGWFIYGLEESEDTE